MKLKTKLGKRRITLADIRISATAKKYVLSVLNTNRLSYGPFTLKYEKKFAVIHRRRFAIMTNSGTSGLAISIAAFKELEGWQDGDEILVPAVTFIASANAVIHNHLRPVFVDVESDYYCLDPKQIEAKITPKTRAIMPVHLFGQSADMAPILTIAKKYKLKIIEDSCETMFVNYHGKPVGSEGDVSVFSTYVTHIIATGVGGMITTNDEKVATLIKSLIFHGRNQNYLRIEDDDSAKNDKQRAALIKHRFEFNHIGYSYRLTEMEAALGVAELERKAQIIKKRQLVGQKLTAMLTEFSNFFQLPQVRLNSVHIYMLFPIVIKDVRINKTNLLLFLEKNGIETRLFMPLLTQPIYTHLFGAIEHNYPVAKMLVTRGFIIGSHPYITDDDIIYLRSLLKKFLQHEKLLV